MAIAPATRRRPCAGRDHTLHEEACVIGKSTLGGRARQAKRRGDRAGPSRPPSQGERNGDRRNADRG
ncbi:hypothetical protein, partial [Escherichia coli]|uniref:hypothetical protein n=1 Tax=Escherichia coli TaxID=562 RepID=UPI001A923DC4